MYRRVFVMATGAVTAALLGFAPSGDVNAKYPVDTVTLVTHSSPGSGSDVFLRELIKYLGPEMGVNFIVDNVRGGSGAKAMTKLGQSPADGSVLYATTPTYIQTTLLSNPEFGYDSLDPVVTVFYDPGVIYARADAPFNSVADVVDYAKKNPGKGKWGASNPASLERIVLEQMKRKAGVEAAVVSHEGGGDLIINVLNGTLDIGVGEVQEVLPQLEAGKIKLLGVLTEERIRSYPDLKTVREQGIDIAVLKFRGLAGPKNLPAEVVQAWETAIQKVLADPQYKAKYESENLVPAFRGQQKARAFTEQFAKDVAASLKELGISKKKK